MAAHKGNKYAEGNEGGAPKIGLDVLWDGWQEEIISMYSSGASDVEIRALILIKNEGNVKASYNLWERWLEEEEEFCETIKKGRMLSHAWWEQNGRENLKESKFNPTLWYMNMKNRFGWKDKQELTGADNKPLIPGSAEEKTDEELMAIVNGRGK
ncbi:MAG: hypothetical protein KAV87_24050 [Desulfobacteraceae bacterium]|nr:hypothetical protein [Desulfobacteraceae bacterium]